MAEEKPIRAQLRHSSDAQPGYARRRSGRGWAYFDETGQRIVEGDVIDRLNAIGLPPAYTRAWFCKDPNGHLQATGIDARGRKQYRYHSAFRARRDKKKYTGTMEFGSALPRLRRKVEADLSKPALDKDRVVAAVVRLLDTQYLRVGNEQYAKENKSFGATTMRSRHVRSERGRLLMRFPGKHGIIQEVAITDSRLKRVVGRCHELPGRHLFQYIDENGTPCPITSADVNDYIRQATGGDFTAKNFRTWAASVIAFEQMLEAQEQEKAKISLKTVLEPVAEALGNTPAISRKAYVHPALLEAVKANPRDPLGGLERPAGRDRLSGAEVGLLEFLSSHSAARNSL